MHIDGIIIFYVDDTGLIFKDYNYWKLVKLQA